MLFCISTEHILSCCIPEWYMPYLQYLGLGGDSRCPDGTSPHTWGTILRTIPLKIPHISLSCTVCDREIWVSVEFTKIFPKTFNTTKENIYICNLSGLGQSRLSTNPSGKIPTTNPPLYSNIYPRHATHKRIEWLPSSRGSVVVHWQLNPG